MIATLAVSGGLLLLVAAGLLFGLAIGAPGHDGPPSDHFDGRLFRNVEPTPLPTAGMGLRLLSEMDRGPWAERRAVPARPRPPERVGPGEIRATFVNHATVLLQVDGANLLTDPIWSERASPVGFAGPRRYHPPGIPFEALPPIDLVLLSHDHYDHLDLPTLRRLGREHDPLVVAGLGNRATLERAGLRRIRELDWGEALEAGPLRIVGQRTRHFSGRGAFDRQRTLWLAYVVESRAGRVYFAGDTGWGSHFEETGERFGPFWLALLPIGAYAPRWFMGPLHIDPAEAVRAHLALRAEQSLAIHHGTFRLTQEAQDEPRRLLGEALAEAGVPAEAFAVLEPGESLAL